MTANTEMLAGAPSHDDVNWQTINWSKAHKEVRRLQARIVQATKEGRWGKVKALQRLLTHSFSGKVLAVKRVTENHGKHTPGVDKEIWNTTEKKETAVQRLSKPSYHPRPLRRLYIKKQNGKLRPLGIPSMIDRAHQALHLLSLDPISEVTADGNSYGFRKERSTADAIGQCFKNLNQKTSAEWVLEGDIRACYDTISHEWLEAHIPINKGILHKWLKAGFIDKQVLYPTDEGTPQGSIISPVMANMTLDGLEALLKEKFPRYTPTGSSKVNMVRFADDFVITGRSKELLENEVKPLVEEFMKERGLTLSAEKTLITHIEEGFDFLGQNIRKYNGTLLIKPAKKNIKTFLDKVRKVTKENKQIPAHRLVVQLNPLIRGWANYHRHVVSKQTFNYVDHKLVQILWRWAKRRHPGKQPEWIRKKYFRSFEGRDWTFYGEETDEKGKKEQSRLLIAASIPIKRHIKIVAKANPYDPKWETYFEKRLDVKMEADLKGRRKLLYLWKEQKGICPTCKQKITKLTGWHNHHIIWRSLGGGDGAENRVLLHPECHRQVHSQRVTVRKPRP